MAIIHSGHCITTVLLNLLLARLPFILCSMFQLFEDVVDILDPEMNLVTEDEDDYDDDDDADQWEGYDIRGVPVLDLTAGHAL